MPDFVLLVLLRLLLVGKESRIISYAVNRIPDDSDIPITFEHKPGFHKPLISPSVLIIVNPCERKVTFCDGGRLCIGGGGMSCHRTFKQSKGLNKAHAVPAATPADKKCKRAGGVFCIVPVIVVVVVRSAWYNEEGGGNNKSEGEANPAAALLLCRMISTKSVVVPASLFRRTEEEDIFLGVSL